MATKINTISAINAGIAGTLVMTVVMYALPLIGIPPMDLLAALGSVFPFKFPPYILGAVVHIAIGIVLSLIYAALFFTWLPGPNWAKGMLFSLLPWLYAITLLGPSLQVASNILGGAPTRVAGNPCAVKAQPCAPKPANPCAAPANPCAAKVQPCAPTAQPCMAKAQPCAATAQPCAPKMQPCAPAAANPCAPGGAAGGPPPQLMSLIVHLIYGGVVGAIYRPKM